MSGLVEFSADSRSKTIGQNFRCRAWVQFNGTGSVPIRGSGNVSSITDNGTGDYTITFATPMPTENYSVVGMMDNGGSSVWLSSLEIYYVGSFSASSVRINATRVSSVSNRYFSDLDYICLAMFH